MRIIHSMNTEQAPAFSARSGRPTLDLRVAAMRRTGMSATAIRRALGLSLAQAVAAGIVAPSLPARADPSPARPARRATAPVPAPPAARSAPPAGPRMAEVLEAVARAADLAPEQLLGPGHNRSTARPRQLVMYLLRTLCAGASLPTIGYFLGRDHTTVLYGCRKAETLLQRDAAFQALHARARGALAAAGRADSDAETPA